MDLVHRYPVSAFTLVEILIVIAIIGILAAIVIPEIQYHSQQAKESAAKQTLQILRDVIELYAAQNGGIAPGYKNNNPDSFLSSASDFYNQLFFEGHYLSKVPENPLNGDARVRIIPNNGSFPVTASGSYGWVYQPFTKKIRLDYPGTDSQGILYYDY
jgi:general secretion pathway protein G